MDWWIVLAVVVTLVIFWAVQTAQRLDRLHIRTDSALQGLAGALDNRVNLVEAVLADAARGTRGGPRTVARDGAEGAGGAAGAGHDADAAGARPGGGDAGVVNKAVVAARRAGAVTLRYGTLPERAERERELTAALAAAHAAGVVFPAVLSEANARVEMAMRFYNDAVRVTRALRLRPAVRLLRLGGTAKLPRYFEESRWDAVAGDTMSAADGPGNEAGPQTRPDGK
ncbi:hypothetical protein [Corynebacterium frankenforstense]|uniref:hypothetical protein n=1 Tax=Corynebacterium frankenforstense TaxID=1230998 RepID=UPI000952F1B8|nr:hypothetical protein [Corynebacterium frankenforstense]